MGANGTVYIAAWGNSRVRAVGLDGIIYTVAGGGPWGNVGDGGPATAADMGPNDIALAPDGSLLIAGSYNDLIRRVRHPAAGYTATPIVLPSRDGRELYGMTAEGRHLETRDSRTGTATRSLSCDPSGLLKSLTDRDGLVTTIARAPDGSPTAITGPYGQVTTLALDANRSLAAVTNPAGNTEQFSYNLDRQLTLLSRPDGKALACGLVTAGQAPAVDLGRTAGSDTCAAPRVRRQRKHPRPCCILWLASLRRGRSWPTSRGW